MTPDHPFRAESTGSSGALDPQHTPQGTRDDPLPTRERQQVSLLDVAAIVLARRWTILAFVILVPALIVVVSMILPRQWTSEAAFMPQSTGNPAYSNLTSLASQFGFDIGNGPAGQSPEFYADLAGSREILQQVAGGTFAIADTTGTGVNGSARRPLADILNIEAGPSDLRNEKALEWLQEKAVSVSSDAQSGIVTVSVTTRWPVLSSEIAGQIVALVNQFNLQTRASQATAERRFVQERMDAARDDLRVSENQLQHFLQNNRVYENSPQLTFEHDRLERQVAMRQELYTSLAQSYEQARIAEVRNTPLITVVERAETPILPDRRYILLKAIVGLVVGVLAGIGVALVREYVRHERSEAPERAKAVSALWRETRDDVRRLTHRSRRAD